MASNDQPRFRITAWMGGPLPLIPAYRHKYVLDEDREVLVEANEGERAMLDAPSGGDLPPPP